MTDYRGPRCRSCNGPCWQWKGGRLGLHLHGVHQRSPRSGCGTSRRSRPEGPHAQPRQAAQLQRLSCGSEGGVGAVI